MKLLLALAFCAIASAGWFDKAKQTEEALPVGYFVAITSNTFFFFDAQHEIFMVLPRASVSVIQRSGKWRFLLPDGTEMSHEDDNWQHRMNKLVYETDMEADGKQLPSWYKKYEPVNKKEL
jgi:hypothetical protein